MADNNRALVHNAGDPKQVKRAARLEKDKAAEFRGNMRAVMDTPYGRAFMWELLSMAGVFRSIYHPSSAIYYNAGRQDFGHELMANALTADAKLYLLMQQEASERADREKAAIDAAHTTGADDTKEKT